MVNRIEKISYIFGWIGLGLGIAGALFLRNGAFDFIHGRDLCTIHRLTHLYCPGCGITRACFALSNGQGIRSILYHPLPVYVLGLYLFWMGYVTVCLIRSAGKDAAHSENPALLQAKKRAFYGKFLIAVYVMIALLLLQWILKLVVLFACHRDWFAMVEGLSLW